METIRVFEAFSGIGAQAKAIELLNQNLNSVKFEVVGTCDWGVKIKPKYLLLEIAKKRNYTIKTLTTKQDRNPNVGVIEYNAIREHYLPYRFITPREAFKIMGFTDLDFDKLIIFYVIIGKTALYRQAGNSIVVNCLYSVFKLIFLVEIMISIRKFLAA